LKAISSNKKTELDTTFRSRVIEHLGGENLGACFQCGTCSASCPIQLIDERYNPRKIIRRALLGSKDVLSEDFIWLCVNCYSCYERCPQDVRVTEVINAIKNLAVEDGIVHPSLVKLIEVLKERGTTYEVGKLENQKRERLGLPIIDKKSDDIKKILDKK